MTTSGHGADAIELDSVVCPKSTVASVEADGETVVYDETTAAMHVLNPTGSVVWSLLDGKVSLRQTCAEIAESFGADLTQVRLDVLTLVRELHRHNLLDHSMPGQDAAALVEPAGEH